MKIGRNEPCHCGSGKKFKRCCIGTSELQGRHPISSPPEMMARAQELMRLHLASENVRQQQQGYGKPIMSWTDHDYRVVVVGTTIHFAQNWLVFPDFLLEFMKKTLGREWGMREKDKGSHPVFTWLAKFKKYSDSLPTGGNLKSGQIKGFIACCLHLSYALYLIDHNDQLPKPLLKRLRNPTTFMPAYYEAIVGAALAVAGFEISNAETKASSTPKPEFRAKSKTTGKVYDVEAKRKEQWKSPTGNVNHPDFRRELESYVRHQIHASSKKRLSNPIYWFELSIPTLMTEADWRIIAAMLKDIIRHAAQNMTIGRAPIAPAFIVVTNHTFLANDEIVGEPSFAVLETIKIGDYPFGRTIEIEDALIAYDKYRDIFWMMEAWKVARSVPITYDGTPPELLSPDGIPQRTIRIGDVIDTQFDGHSVKAKVTEIATMDSEAMVALSANGHHWFAKVPLSEREAQAAARFTDAVFGKDNAARGLRHEDPFDLYDFLLRAYANMTQEDVVKFFEQNPTVRQYKDLPLKDARVRIAREYTKWIWANSHPPEK